MIAVIFEVEPRDGKREAYLDIAAELRPLLERVYTVNLFGWGEPMLHKEFIRFIEVTRECSADCRINFAPWGERDYVKNILHNRDRVMEQCPPNSRLTLFAIQMKRRVDHLLDVAKAVCKPSHPILIEVNHLYCRTRER